MTRKPRYLWFFHYSLHNESRVWWSYFKDWSELQVCLAELSRAFPLEWQKLEICPEGLKMLGYAFSATSSEQEEADAQAQEMVGVRDQQLFPLAPLACSYLASFRASLGNTLRAMGEVIPPHVPVDEP